MLPAGDDLDALRHQVEVGLGVVLLERLQRRALRENRLDDANLEVIKRRLAVYEKETRSVLDCYDPKLVHQIDSTLTPLEVLMQILDLVAKMRR